MSLSYITLCKFSFWRPYLARSAQSLSPLAERAEMEGAEGRRKEGARSGSPFAISDQPIRHFCRNERDKGDVCRTSRALHATAQKVTEKQDTAVHDLNHPTTYMFTVMHNACIIVGRKNRLGRGVPTRTLSPGAAATRRNQKSLPSFRSSPSLLPPLFVGLLAAAKNALTLARFMYVRNVSSCR